MRNHPLTPMTDANLVRVLQAQTRRKVGHVGYGDVARGPEAVRARFAQLKADGVGCRHRRRHLRRRPGDAGPRRGRPAARRPRAPASRIGLTQNFAEAGLLRAAAAASALPPLPGQRAIVSGSCSEATNAQVAHFMRSGGQSCALDPLALAAGKAEVERVLDWARPLLPSRARSWCTPPRRRTRSRRCSSAWASTMPARSSSARWPRSRASLVAAGVRQLIVAGGETSGAVVQALDVRALRIGPQIDPGVPWTHDDGRGAGAARAQIGQFRRARISLRGLLTRSDASTRRHEGHEGHEGAGGVNERKRITRADLRCGEIDFRPRADARQHRQHQRALRGRLASHADGLQPGPARSGATVQARLGRAAHRRAIAPSKESFLHLAMYQEREATRR